MQKYHVSNYNDVAVLCKSNATAAMINRFMQSSHKLFSETQLDRDNSDWGRFFREVLLSRFDEEIYAVDFAEALFDQEYEPAKYRTALNLCQEIFNCQAENIYLAEKQIVMLAKLVYPQKQNTAAAAVLHDILNNPELLRSYIPASKNEVNIMTLHKSKGLEFSIVFHMDLYKWVFPYEKGTEEQRKQDLNLHYVGVTRAKEVCYIMNGSMRYSRKIDDFSVAEPSPFLQLPGLQERRKTVEW